MFEGRLPAQIPGSGAEGRRDRGGPRGLDSSTARSTSRSGSTPSSGASAKTGRSSRPASTRCAPVATRSTRRVRDMDINGVWASVNFPSQITGFCGAVFSRCSDPDLGLAVTQAWNDWFHEEWYSPHPRPHRADGHHLPRPTPSRAPRRSGATRRAASPRSRCRRSRTASAWSRSSRRGGNRSSPRARRPAPSSACTSVRPASPTCRKGAPMVPLGATLFGQLSLSACAEWLWSGHPVRHPDLKIIMSEGGIGWVAMLHDRLENIVDRSGYGHYFGGDLRPAEVLRRNFWFCDDRRSVDVRARATRSGSRTSCSSPTTPTATAPGRTRKRCSPTCSATSPPTEIAKISHENAAALFRHPLPPPSSPHAIGLRS